MVTLTFESTTITLRSPNLGNKDIARKERIKKESRGGETIVFTDPEWPKQREINYDFDTLTLPQVTTLQAFVKNSLGKMVTLVDFEDKTFTGIITNPDVESKQDSRKCDYSLSLKFLVVP